MRALGILLIGCISLLVALSGESAGAKTVEALVPIRIGWQVSGATQAQIAQVLKRTDVLDLQGLEPLAFPFSFGAPQIEDALAGKLDVIFADDQPAINLLSGGKWKIVARLYYDRVAIMVPPGSPIRNIEDLKGKTVASPFGSAAHRVAILLQRQAGLDPEIDVDNRDLDILEIRNLVRADGVEAWGDVDAVTVWEPTASHFELEGLARTLKDSPTLGVVAMSDKFVARHPEASVQFLIALERAWYYFSQHTDRVRQWYLDEAQLGYTPESLFKASVIEPNYDAKSLSDIELRLTDKDWEDLERASAWAKERGYGAGEVDIRGAVDQRLLSAAMDALASGGVEEIEVIMPPAREAAQGERVIRRFYDIFPQWSLFVAMILFTLLAIWVGQMLGEMRRKRGIHEREGPVGTVVGAELGLLAFVLALTFAAAGNRFDARKRALLDEVNAIGTAYLRANLLSEPDRTTSRALLREYVESRLGMHREFGDAESLRALQRRTDALQQSLWSNAEFLAKTDPRSLVFALFTESLNEVFDLNTTRIALGAEYRIPVFSWCVLGMISFLAMVTVGFHFGLGGRGSLSASLSLSVTFALVILVILDLDRPGEGLIEVDQAPMKNLFQSLSIGE